MIGLEKRFYNEEAKNPLYSTIVNFAEAVSQQRYGRHTIVKYFKELVDKDDYLRRDFKDIISHMLKLSFSKKAKDSTQYMAN